MRRLVLPLVLALAACLAACGDDVPASTPGPVGTADTAPSPDVPGRITFLDGLAAGREAAGGDDVLMFVYLGRDRPT